MNNPVKVYMIEGGPAKVCPGCNTLKDLNDFARDMSKSDGKTSHCKDCRNKQKKRYRSNPANKFKDRHHKKMRGMINPENDRAKGVISNMLKNGLITKPTHCQVCHKEADTEGHHPDYSKPYEVYFLCKDCHAFVHSGAYINPYEKGREK